VVRRRRRRFWIGLVCELFVALVAAPVLIPGTSLVEEVISVVGLFAAAIGLAAMMNLETHDRNANRHP